MKTHYAYCKKNSNFWEKEKKFYISGYDETQSLTNCIMVYKTRFKEVDFYELIVDYKNDYKIISSKKIDDNIVKKILMLL